MAPLSTFSLPLLPSGLPAGYGWEERDVSVLSTTTAFNTGVDRRDTFLGQRRCVVCGEAGGAVLQHCHISKDSEPQLWFSLKARNWIPSQAKSLPRHEPRGGLLMCSNHHLFFNAYDFFIRFFPDIRKFVFVNYSGDPALQRFHGKAIALDIRDHHAPFPSLFIIHEMRVRGFHPFQPVAPAMPDDIHWQDWISSHSVFDDVSGTFNRDGPLDNSNNLSMQPQTQSQPTTTSTGRRALALNADIISDILAATHAMPSWRACQMEGTSWSGTAEENIHKYVSSIGVQDRRP
ncbi:uncharacterized protein BJ212DRAFT_1444544 [Suillus subaureus]|uniref:HNH nuclease domain-containing protein n=1 Tax=Suillus subaureus TaxID=48587 RepID=A0A9P7EJ24_9AGAM|nr:uncharacterized protein BJ212DRAFT_1444544 [Suillus subaureus]KAG1823355.1 hypothetical protein BJ212DRAFT_1444544 [Suillus subaureus]